MYAGRGEREDAFQQKRQHGQGMSKRGRTGKIGRRGFPERACNNNTASWLVKQVEMVGQGKREEKLQTKAANIGKASRMVGQGKPEGKLQQKPTAMFIFNWMNIPLKAAATSTRKGGYTTGVKEGSRFAWGGGTSGWDHTEVGRQ